MIDKKLLQELQPYRRKIYIITAMNIMRAVAVIIRCYLLADIIDKMLFSRINLRTAGPFLVLLFFSFTVEILFNTGIRLLTHNISAAIRSSLRRRIIDRLIGSSPLAAVYKTDILQLATKGIDSFDAYYSRFLPQLLATLCIPIFIIITAAYSDLISGIVFLLTLPLIPFFMILIGKRAQAENKQQWEALTSLSNKFMEMLSGISVIKIYNQITEQLKQLTQTGNEFSQAVLKVLRIAFLSAFFLELIATLSIAVIAVNIGLRLLAGHAVFLPAFFMLLLAPEFYKPLRQTGSMFHDAMGALTNAAPVYTAISPITEKAIVPKLSIVTAPQIILENISMSYSESRGKALDNINMDFPAGKITALVGASGAGKSTVLSLLLGFIKPTAGRILAGDQDINNYSVASWQNNIAYMPQNPHIFAASLRENICLGRTITEEQLQLAVKQAQLAELVQKLPEGIDTVIGNGGIALSIGQVRRVALARVFLADAPILLLDEPLEGLDVKTEAVVQKTMQKLVQNKTVIVIAHRLYSLQNAAKIYVLNNGCVVEQGSIKELLESKGFYYKMQQITGGAVQ